MARLVSYQFLIPHDYARMYSYKLDCVFSKEPPPAKDPSKQPVKKTTGNKQASANPEGGAAVLHR